MQARSPDVAAPPGADVESEIRRWLSHSAVRRAVRNLRRFKVGEFVNDQLGHVQQSTQHQHHAFPSNRAEEQQVSDDIEDVAEQMAHAAAAEHPADGGDRKLQQDAIAAVEWVAAFGSGARAQARVESARREVRQAIEREARRLQWISEEIRRIGPEHIRRMPLPIHTALVQALTEAADLPDSRLALDLACGMHCVGDIPASGWWREELTPASTDIGSLDHDEWHDRMEATIAAEAADPEKRGDLQTVLERTREEVAKRNMNGPFTRDQMDTAYGKGEWRAMRRFGVRQNGKVRPCDNGRTSWHNACTTRHEKMLCDGADFPARAAAAFAEAYEGVVSMAAGTEDMADAYRTISWVARP